MQERKVSRRSFMGSMTASAFGFTIVPRHVLGGPGYTAPSDKINFAVIGAGAQGLSNARDAIGGDQTLVAFADVDMGFVDRQIANLDRNNNAAAAAAGAKVKEAYQKARRYTDYRQMLERERNNIDGIIIATPDHFHAVAANHSMQAGKAVYVQKPLTWSVHEARTLAATAARTGVVTQMGNQGHSGDGTRQMVEWINAGVIGPVSEVHIWTNRPIWPQGIPRPTTQALRASTGNPSVAAPRPAGAVQPPAQPGQVNPAPQPPNNTWENQRTINQPLAAAMAASNYPVPAGVNWDVFIGPAPMVDYHPLYHPFNWRGWVDWGAGALGDMGAHLIDQPFWALNLGLPTSIEATSSPFGLDIDDTPATFPQAMTVHYEFAARANMPAVKMYWYDGGLMPPHPPQIPDEMILERGGGGYFVGTKGVLLYDTYGQNPRLFPASLKEAADRVPQTIERVPTNHVMNWANAVMEKAKPSSDFAYASKLTETMLLGLVALRTGQGRKIIYDGAAGRITNIPEANYLLTREYRQGWSL
jgi:predicted dehydrogenase